LWTDAYVLIKFDGGLTVLHDAEEEHAVISMCSSAGNEFRCIVIDYWRLTVAVWRSGNALFSINEVNLR